MIRKSKKNSPPKNIVYKFEYLHLITTYRNIFPIYTKKIKIVKNIL